MVFQASVAEPMSCFAAVREDNEIERYGLNAVCTHLGCVVSHQRTSLAKLNYMHSHHQKC